MAKAATKVKQNSASYAVYSTLTSGVDYVEWKQTADLPVKGFTVAIAGGAGVAHKRGLITPFGVKTEVTEDEMNFLNSNDAFKRALSDGWHTVIKISGWMDSADNVAAAMMQRDGSAPLVPNDFNHLPTELQPKVNGSRADGTEPTVLPRTRPFAPMTGKMFRT